MSIFFGKRSSVYPKNGKAGRAGQRPSGTARNALHFADKVPCQGDVLWNLLTIKQAEYPALSWRLMFSLFCCPQPSFPNLGAVLCKRTEGIHTFSPKTMHEKCEKRQNKKKELIFWETAYILKSYQMKTLPEPLPGTLPETYSDGKSETPIQESGESIILKEDAL